MVAKEARVGRFSGDGDPVALKGWWRGWGVAVLAFLVVIGMAGIPALTSARGSGSPFGPAQVSGVVQVEGTVSSGWTVELFAAGVDGARLMDSAVTDQRGAFRVRTRPPSAGDDVVQYLVATRGPTERMIVSLGPPAETPRAVVVNELATIATIWTHAQFIDGSTIAGNAVGLRAASRNVPNLVDLRAGVLGSVVLDTANLQTNTAATMGTLAGLLGQCLTDGCAPLFALSAPPGAPPPTDTINAFQNVALNPWHNVLPIYQLLERGSADRPDNPFFLPTLLYPPTAWTLSLVYTEGGFNAPGGLGLDAEGNVWTNNNFMVGSQSVLLDLGNLIVPNPDAYAGIGATKLTSNGAPVSPATGFLGGGTFGAAFGLAVDEEGNAWIGNFGGNSVTKLAPDGSPLSPSATGFSSSGGYRDDAHNPMSEPQGTIVTADGSVWLANLFGDNVTQLVGGDPTKFRTWGAPDCAEQFDSPWGLASDADGNVYVSNTRGRSVSMIDPDTAPDSLCPVATYPLHAEALPQGLAVDMDANVWVADTYGGGVVTFLDASEDHAATSFTADDTIVGPWSLAIDGANNVWVADFFGKRIENLCGASGNCPQGMDSLGARISPPGDPSSGALGNGGGYGANGALESITSINIDQAGNVWVANNFNNVRECLLGEGIPTPILQGPSTVEQEELQTECGGNGAVVMFGVAAPVATPIIGPPRHP